MKSPYQIAKELNVSPQAIYKRLTNEFNNQFNNHIQRTQKGRYLLDPVAEQGLRDLFNIVQQPVQQSPIEPVVQPLLNQLNSENEFLRHRIDVLEQELKVEREHSREQTDRLTNLAAKLAALTENSQVLLGAEQSRTNPVLLNGTTPDEPISPPKNFFIRLFERKKQ